MGLRSAGTELDFVGVEAVTAVGGGAQDTLPSQVHRVRQEGLPAEQGPSDKQPVLGIRDILVDPTPFFSGFKDAKIIFL
jgi:hypothetical protein